MGAEVQDLRIEGVSRDAGNNNYSRVDGPRQARYRSHVYLFCKFCYYTGKASTVLYKYTENIDK